MYVSPVSQLFPHTIWLLPISFPLSLYGKSFSKRKRKKCFLLEDKVFHNKDIITGKV